MDKSKIKWFQTSEFVYLDIVTETLSRFWSASCDIMQESKAANISEKPDAPSFRKKTLRFLRQKYLRDVGNYLYD
jgi:hypothetical protein